MIPEASSLICLVVRLTLPFICLVYHKGILQFLLVANLSAYGYIYFKGICSFFLNIPGEILVSFLMYFAIFDDSFYMT